MNELEDNILEKVKNIFTEYLQRHDFRKTPERFMILKEVYTIDGHFDIDSLYVQMKNKKFHVSKATLYNTIELLMDCNLVTKHQFGQNRAQFERSYKFKQHDHFVDIVTGDVFEYCDPRIMEIQKSVEDMFDVEIAYHSLTFYGTKKRHKRKRIGSKEKLNH